MKPGRPHRRARARGARAQSVADWYLERGGSLLTSIGIRSQCYIYGCVNKLIQCAEIGNVYNVQRKLGGAKYRFVWRLDTTIGFQRLEGAPRHIFQLKTRSILQLEGSFFLDSASSLLSRRWYWAIGFVRNIIQHRSLFPTKVLLLNIQR